ncbi:uncharacterized protein [Haliotis asinina]|uniref:uncharacterized protein n=1 Tax=Haliotis asinina TaxID=109174 RepID=UPI0035327FAE
MSLVNLIALLIVAVRQPAFSGSIDDIHRLRHHLFNNYTSDVRPLLNQSQPLVIDVNFQFMRIHRIDNAQKEFSIRGILSLAWKDYCLRWKSADFGDLRHYHPKQGEIWTPSILNEDGVGSQEVMGTITRRVLYNNGSVVVHVPGYFSTFCNFDMTYFPFDSQTCIIKMNSLDSFAEELEFRPVSEVTTIGNYKDAEWTVVWSTMTSDEINIALQNYSRVRVMFQVVRKPLFAILNIVIPIVTISILSMMVFLVPVESGEKLSFSLSALLSLAVFMSFITEQIPASSEKPPLLVIYLTSMVLLNALQSTFSATIDDLHRLRHHLFNNYSSDIRPLLNQSQPLVIDVSFQLIRIHCIDNTQKEFSIRGILSLAWKDEFLTWNSSDFGGLRHYHPKKGEVWTPSILNEDGVEDQDVMDTINRCMLYKNGSVLVLVPGYFSTFCNFDMTYFPFDSQTCIIQMNSLDYFAEELEFRPVSKQLTKIGNHKDAEWTVVRAAITNGEIIVPSHSYSRVRVMFQVARKPLFAILNIVIPIVTISILSMMVFLIPVESGEKLSFSLSALLSLAVFMSFITEQIPASSEKTPLLVIYLTSMVLLNALSVVSTVLILLCHHRDCDTKDTRADNDLSNQNTSDVVMEKASFRNLISLICCGKDKKYWECRDVPVHESRRVEHKPSNTGDVDLEVKAQARDNPSANRLIELCSTLILSVLNGRTGLDSDTTFTFVVVTSFAAANIVSQQLLVEVNFRFLRIHRIDNTKKEFSIRGILSLAWKDDFLSWKSTDFGGLRHYHPKKGEIWIPSILNEDGVGSQEVMDTTTRRVLYNNGSVVVHVLGYFSTFCNFDMTYFPFDNQICEIRLNSLDYFAEELEFRLVSQQVTKIGKYNADAEWAMVWATMTSKQISIPPQSYARVSILFQLRRKSLFAILNIVIPIVTISVLSMMVFLVPVESGEKLSFSLSALLSLAVFMSFISEQIPASSEKTPLLVIYLTSMVLMNALSVACTVLVLLCHHRGSVSKETRACSTSSNLKTTDNVMEKPSRRIIHSLICCGKNEKHVTASRALNNTLLLLFMGVVIGITIGIMARMTSNN